MKVERIYVIFNSDCHEYLIDYEYYNAFENEYDNICDLLRSNDIDGDVFNYMLDNLLDLYCLPYNYKKYNKSSFFE